MRRPTEPQAEHPTSVAVVAPAHGRRGVIGWTYRDQRGWALSQPKRDRDAAIRSALAAGFGAVVDADGMPLARRAP